MNENFHGNFIKEGVWFEKDRNGKYLCVSEGFAEAAGQDSPQDCIGRTDDQFIWQYHGNTCHQSDRLVLSGIQRIKEKEWIKSVPGWLEVIVVKNLNLHKAQTLTGSLMVTESLESPLINQFCQQRSVYVAQIGSCLDWDEIMALRHLLYGYCVKTIARLINRGEATVYNLINNVKRKFNVNSKPALITELHRTGVAVLVNVIESHRLWEEGSVFVSEKPSTILQ